MEAALAANPSLLIAAQIKCSHNRSHMRKLKKNIKSVLVKRRPLEKKPLLEIDEPRDPDFKATTANTGRNLRRLVTSIKSHFKATPSKQNDNKLISAKAQMSGLSEVSSQSDDVKLRAEYDVEVSQCVDSVFGDDFDDCTPLLGDADVTEGKSKGLKKQALKAKAALARKLSRGGKLKYAIACCPLSLRKRNGCHAKDRYDQQNTGRSWDSDQSQ